MLSYKGLITAILNSPTFKVGKRAPPFALLHQGQTVFVSLTAQPVPNTSPENEQTKA